MRLPCFAASAVAVLVAGLAACGHPAAYVRPTYVAPEIPKCAGPPPPAIPSAPPRQMVQQRHSARVVSLAFAPNGQLASASEDGSARIWSVKERALLRVLRTPEVREPSAIAWDAAGEKLALLGVRSGGVVLDVEGRIVARIEPGMQQLFTQRPAASQWFGLTREGLVRIDAASCALSVPTGPADVYADPGADISADGAVLVAANFKELKVYAASTGAPVRTIALPGYAKGLALAPRGDVALVTIDTVGNAPSDNPDHQALLVPLDGTSPVRPLSTNLVQARSVALAADASLAAVVVRDPKRPFAFGVAVWDTRTRAMLWQRLGDNEAASRVAISPDGAWLVVTGERGKIVVYDARSGRVHGELGSAPARTPLAVEHVSAEMLAVTAEGETTVWSLARAEVVQRGPGGFGGRAAVTPTGDVVSAVPFSYGSKRKEKGSPCAAGDLPLAIEGWDGIHSPTRAAAADGAWPPRGGATRPVCLRDVTKALSGAAVGMEEILHDVDVLRGRAIVQLWPDAHATLAVDNLRTGARVTLEDSDRHRTARFSPDGSVVAAIRKRPDPATGRRVMPHEDFERATFWDVTTGKQIGFAMVGLPFGDDQKGDAVDAPTGVDICTLEKRDEVRGRPRNVGADGVDVAPDGSAYVVYRQRRFNVSPLRGQASDRPVDLDRAITAVRFGRSATELLVGTEDGRLHVFRDGKRVASGVSAGGAITTVRASPDGKTVTTVSDDGAIRVWDAATAAVRATLVDFEDDEHIAFTPGGAYAGTIEVSERVGWIYEAPTEAFRFEQFASRFRDASLPRARLAGDTRDVESLRVRPPVATFAGVPAISADGTHVRVHLRASSATRIDAVRLFAEGRPVDAKAICAREGEVDLDAQLFRGANRLSATAFDDRGFASNPAFVDVVGRGAGARVPDIWVVSVGIDHYPNLPPDMQLGFAAADARGIATAFGALAGPGKSYARAHVRLMTDAQVTADSVRDALMGLEEMAPEDVAVVFFGGHGVKPSEQEEMVFVTGSLEATQGEHGIVVTPESARRNGIGWHRMGELLARTRGRVVVFLDACHSGHVSTDVIVPSSQLADRLTGAGRAGVVVFAAAKGRQLSYEPSGSRGLVLDDDQAKAFVARSGDHGLFTGALLGALASTDTDRDGDGAIELSELVAEVSERVDRATRGKQTPWIARREGFGDFRLLERR